MESTMEENKPRKEFADPPPTYYEQEYISH